MQRSSCSRLRWSTAPKVLTFISSILLSSSSNGKKTPDGLEPSSARFAGARLASRPRCHGWTRWELHPRATATGSLVAVDPPATQLSRTGGSQAHVVESLRAVSNRRRRVGNPVLWPLSYEGRPLRVSIAAIVFRSCMRVEGFEPPAGLSPPASEAGASPLRHTRVGGLERARRS